jgi:hypothetical protein
MITNNETIAVILDKLPVSLIVFRGVHVDFWLIEECFFSSICYVVFKKVCPDEMHIELGKMWKKDFSPL